jgi:small multidrug resistance family-3 protein
MKLPMVLAWLFVSALLEASGDALVRAGLRGPSGLMRFLNFLAGGVVLFGYGYLVNVVPWDFGRVLGLYIVFFFVVAQVIAWLVFGQAPSRGLLLGGAFIVIGGAIIATSER